MELRPADIEVHIEELVLHGFDAGDRHGIAAAIRQEMTRLVAMHGVPRAWTAAAGAHAALEGGQFSAVPGATPHSTGAAIARSVYGSVRR
jgi:hypothetical protein